MLDAGELSQFDRWATGANSRRFRTSALFGLPRLYRIWRLSQFVKQGNQGNRASEALDEGFEEVIAPACLFEPGLFTAGGFLAGGRGTNG